MHTLAPPVRNTLDAYLAAQNLTPCDLKRLLAMIDERQDTARPGDWQRLEACREAVLRRLRA